MDTTSTPVVPRSLGEPLAAAIAQWALVTGAAGMSAVIWLCAIGAAEWPSGQRPIVAARAEGTHLALPPVLVTGKGERRARASGLPAEAVAACAIAELRPIAC